MTLNDYFFHNYSNIFCKSSANYVAAILNMFMKEQR